MKTTVSLYDFTRAFADADRKENFSYEGLEILFNYFEDCEESNGEEIELDVITICCEYAEDTAARIARYYSIDLSDIDMEDDDYVEQCINAVRDYLSENTQLIGETSTSFIYAIF